MRVFKLFVNLNPFCHNKQSSYVSNGGTPNWWWITWTVVNECIQIQIHWNMLDPRVTATKTHDDAIDTTNRIAKYCNFIDRIKRCVCVMFDCTRDLLIWIWYRVDEWRTCVKRWLVLGEVKSMQIFFLLNILLIDVVCSSTLEPGTCIIQPRMANLRPLCTPHVTVHWRAGKPIQIARTRTTQESAEKKRSKNENTLLLQSHYAITTPQRVAAAWLMMDGMRKTAFRHRVRPFHLELQLNWYHYGMDPLHSVFRHRHHRQFIQFPFFLLSITVVGW